MHPWIAEQANRERIAELRGLGRPFGQSLAGRVVGRLRAARPQPAADWPELTGRRRRISVGF